MKLSLPPRGLFHLEGHPDRQDDWNNRDSCNRGIATAKRKGRAIVDSVMVEVVFIASAHACPSSHRPAPTLQTQGGCCAANIKDQRRAKPGDCAAGSGLSEGSLEGRQSSERSSNRLASSGKYDSSEAELACGEAWQ